MVETIERLSIAERLRRLPECLTIELVREHLQIAIELEHSTLPPYMCGLYSILPDRNREASQLIRSVLMEEMLHMTLAANVLNAIDGQPDIDVPRFVPEYPTPLPDSNEAFIIDLRGFSPEALDTFIRIELPTPRGERRAVWNGYNTIGQFYEAIIDALQRLEAAARREGKTIYTGDIERQIGPDQYYYGGGGDAIVVHDEETAVLALQTIVNQGEGADHTIWAQYPFKGERRELSHYNRFIEVREGRYYRRGDICNEEPTGPSFDVDWDAAYPMITNPQEHKAAFARSPGLIKKYSEFNILYTELLHVLHDAFNGRPDLLVVGVGRMNELKAACIELMRIPVPGKEDRNAGPGFEYVPL